MSLAVWRGFSRTTQVRLRRVVRITPEIVQHDCIECGGTGHFELPHYPPEFTAGHWGWRYMLRRQYVPCVECKGTGRTFA